MRREFLLRQAQGIEHPPHDRREQLPRAALAVIEGCGHGASEAQRDERCEHEDHREATQARRGVLCVEKIGLRTGTAN
jgi:hypothetical protein